MKKVSRLMAVGVAISLLSVMSMGSAVAADNTLKIGVNYPETGPYAKQGLDQKRAADMAAEEINKAGGILGKQIELVYRDDKNKPAATKENVTDLIDNVGCQMVFGGSSSGVAIAAGKVCRAKKKIFFGTLTYSTETTGEEGHKYIFRECYDSGAAAKVVGTYLKNKFAGKKYFYITADYTWGWTTEESFRKYTDTTNKDVHHSILTKLGSTDFTSVLQVVQQEQPDVLVLVLFGRDMEIALKQAYDMGLKSKLQIVVPNLTEDMCEGATPEAAEGVIGATNWMWQLPLSKGYEAGTKFVNNFESKYGRYPTCSGGSAYTILYEYKAAVERAKSLDSLAVIKELEGHVYTSLKDPQVWRDWDHTSVQTVFAVKVKPASGVKASAHQMDYYEVLGSMKGEDAAISKEAWVAARAKVGAPDFLEE